MLCNNASHNHYCCNVHIISRINQTHHVNSFSYRFIGGYGHPFEMSAEPKLYVNATFTSFRRSKRQINPNQALLQIQGVNSKEEAHFYVGKKVASYVKAKVGKDGKKIDAHINWGVITQEHGNSGVVRAKFDRNLPPVALGSSVRVMLFPSTI